jgi:MarR family 2-MHQ and catechol resistance regulon transcriptional repressor
MSEKWDPFRQTLPSVHVFLTIYKTNHLLVQQLEDELGKFELTLGRWCLLVALKSAGRAALPSELSDDLAVTRANISNLLNALEKSGHIERKFDVNNRRRILVHLTLKGEELLRQAWPAYEQSIARLIGDKLSIAEQGQLERLLKKLV